MGQRGKKLLRWVLYGVGVSILPIIWAALSLFIHDKPIVVKELLGNGDLLMATCGGCAVALGEIIGSSRAAESSKIAMGFFSLMVVIGSCLVFSSITEIPLDHTAYENDLFRLAISSLVLFAFGTIFGGITVWVSEPKTTIAAE